MSELTPLTVRDSFALAALQGLVAGEARQIADSLATGGDPYPRLAREAYSVAAAMMAERESYLVPPEVAEKTTTKKKK
jgi:hypothetical protein